MSVLELIQATSASCGYVGRICGVEVDAVDVDVLVTCDTV
jgi:hypothetical protein